MTSIFRPLWIASISRGWFAPVTTVCSGRAFVKRGSRSEKALRWVSRFRADMPVDSLGRQKAF